MHIVDALSRAFMANTGQDDDALNQIVLTVSISDERVDEIRRETKIDPALSHIINMHQAGWPAVKEKVRENAKVYWKYRNELFVHKNVVFLDDRIVGPTALRRTLMQRIHSTGHFARR